MSDLVDGELAFSDDETECTIRLATPTNKKLTPQQILDAVSDLLLGHGAWTHTVKSSNQPLDG